MTIERQAEQTLTSLVSPCTSEQQLSVAEGIHTLTCRLMALDSLACAFFEFQLTSSRLAASKTDELKRVAEALSKRLTYLLEPIQPIETDSNRCIVQMRSNPPLKDDTSTTYYELLVAKGGILTLERYRRVVGQYGRDNIPAQVTREVFIRLVRDFAAVSG